MDIKCTKIGCFHETLFQFKAPEDLYLGAMQKVLKFGWVQNQINLTDDNKCLHLLEEFKELHEWFQKCIDVTMKELQYDPPIQKVVITQSWANKTEKMKSHHGHTHPNSFISGVFYLSHSNPEDGGNTLFYKEQPSLWRKNIFSHRQGEWFRIRPEAGKLILFPSMLYHSVEPHNSESPRYSIAFNTFPTGKLGYAVAASGLNIDTIPIDFNFDKKDKQNEEPKAKTSKKSKT